MEVTLGWSFVIDALLKEHLVTFKALGIYGYNVLSPIPEWFQIDLEVF